MKNEKKLDLILDKLNEEEQIELIENQFIYLFSKAELFLRLGPEKYRKADFFKLPPLDSTLEELEILKLGCIQITDGKGFSESSPLTDMDVSGLNQLMRLFHFESESRSTNYQYSFNGVEGILDCITFKHIIDGRQAIMFNLCNYIE